MKVACSMNVFLVHLIGAPYIYFFYFECTNIKKKTTASFIKKKGKYFVLNCYENELYTPSLFWMRFKQCERVFLLWVSRCSISRWHAHVRGVKLREAVILSWECSMRCVFPTWYNRKDSSLIALNEIYGNKLLPTPIQNKRSILCTACYPECWQPIYFKHILLVRL